MFPFASRPHDNIPGPVQRLAMEAMQVLEPDPASTDQSYRLADDAPAWLVALHAEYHDEDSDRFDHNYFAGTLLGFAMGLSMEAAMRRALRQDGISYGPLLEFLLGTPKRIDQTLAHVRTTDYDLAAWLDDRERVQKHANDRMVAEAQLATAHIRAALEAQAGIGGDQAA